MAVIDTKIFAIKKYTENLDVLPVNRMKARLVRNWFERLEKIKENPDCCRLEDVGERITDLSKLYPQFQKRRKAA
jgi:hypothetical protein